MFRNPTGTLVAGAFFLGASVFTLTLGFVVEDYWWGVVVGALQAWIGLRSLWPRVAVDDRQVVVRNVLPRRLELSEVDDTCLLLGSWMGQIKSRTVGIRRSGGRRPLRCRALYAVEAGQFPIQLFRSFPELDVVRSELDETLAARREQG